VVARALERDRRATKRRAGSRRINTRPTAGGILLTISPSWAVAKPMGTSISCAPHPPRDNSTNPPGSPRRSPATAGVVAFPDLVVTGSHPSPPSEDGPHKVTFPTPPTARPHIRGGRATPSPPWPRGPPSAGSSATCTRTRIPNLAHASRAGGIHPIRSHAGLGAQGPGWRSGGRPISHCPTQALVGIDRGLPPLRRGLHRHCPFAASRGGHDRMLPPAAAKLRCAVPQRVRGVSFHPTRSTCRPPIL